MFNDKMGSFFISDDLSNTKKIKGIDIPENMIGKDI
jgi:hypothetical protein